MKKFLGAIGIAALTLTASNALAQATASANAQARVVAAITLSKTADLNFGDVVASGSAGTVQMTAAGARSAAGGATLGNVNGAQAAAFTVGGVASATYAITLPASTTITSGGNNMTVDTFTSNPSGTSTLPGGGSEALAVGATLHVGANQAAGSYTGSFDVTVAYN